MELFLNLLWFVVAAGLTGFLLRHQRTRASRLHWGSVLAAALFITVLLFPVISASDDLYSQTFLSEDASRRAHNVSGAHPGLVPAVALRSSVLTSSTRDWPRCSPDVLQSGALISLRCVFLPASGLRAPPATLFL